MKKYSIVLVLAAVFPLAILSIYHFLIPRERIGYINSQEVLNRYRGYEEARDILLKKYQQSQGEYDSIRQAFVSQQRYVDSLQSVNHKAVTSETQVLRGLKLKMETYSQQLNEALQQEDMVITRGVINQVNEHIAHYAEENNFSLVLGTASEGTIVYGKDHVDLTQKVIKYLNTTYVSAGL